MGKSPISFPSLKENQSWMVGEVVKTDFTQALFEHYEAGSIPNITRKSGDL